MTVAKTGLLFWKDKAEALLLFQLCWHRFANCPPCPPRVCSWSAPGQRSTAELYIFNALSGLMAQQRNNVPQTCRFAVDSSWDCERVTDRSLFPGHRQVIDTDRRKGAHGGSTAPARSATLLTLVIKQLILRTTLFFSAARGERQRQIQRTFHHATLLQGRVTIAKVDWVDTALFLWCFSNWDLLEMT